MNRFTLPSFAVLSSILLVLPPSGFGGWLQCDSISPSPVVTTKACCRSMAHNHSPLGATAATPVPNCHAQPGNSPAGPLEPVCVCCDSVEAMVPTRATTPDADASFVVQIDEPRLFNTTSVVSAELESIVSPVRLHVLKCVWRC